MSRMLSSGAAMLKTMRMLVVRVGLSVLLATGTSAGASSVASRSTTLSAAFDNGCIVGVRNLLTGERYTAVSNPEDTIGLTLQSGMLAASKALAVRRFPDGHAWITASDEPQPARVITRVTARGTDLIVNQRAERMKGGIGGVEWGIRGLDLRKVKILIPAAGGVIIDPRRTEQDLTYEWPGSWQAAAVFIQGERGGFWIWTQDPRRHFKRLRYQRRGPTATLRFATETDGPADAYRTFGSVTWRLAAYREDWRKPAAQYRALMARSFGLAPLERRRPAWASQIRFVVRADATIDIADLERLAREVPAQRTLIYVPNWRAYTYDENYPEYQPRPEVAAWVKKARDMGFHVMLHFNWAGVNPTHPLREKHDRLLLRDRWTGEMVGWFLDRPHDVAHQIVVLNLAFPEARRLLIERIVQAQEATGCDAIHLDYPALVNSTQGRHAGLNAVGGAEAYLRELRAALPEVAIGTEGIHEALLGCSFAQVGEFFWNADERMGSIHPVRSYIFAPYVHLYGHLGMPDPVHSLPAYVDAVELGLRMASLPALPTHGKTINWQAQGVRLALDLGRLWSERMLRPDFRLRLHEAMAWRGADGARIAFRREPEGWALRKGEAPVLLVAVGANALPTPWAVPGWPAQDGQGVFALDPRQRYLARPSAPARCPVALARPKKPLVLRRFIAGEKRAVIQVGRVRRVVWQAADAMGEVKRLVLVRGRQYPLADGATFERRSAACQGEQRPVIFAHPPWKGRSAGGMSAGDFVVTLPERRGLALRFATGLADVVHDPGLRSAGDGVTFLVFANQRQLYRHHQARGYGWQTHEVPLSEYAGRTVTLRLATGPGPAGDTSFDWACWNDVRIEASEGENPLEFEIISAGKAAATIPHSEPLVAAPFGYRFSIEGESRWAALLFDLQRITLPAALADIPFSVAAVCGALGEDGSVFGSGSVSEVDMRGVSMRALSGHTPDQGQTCLDWALALPQQPCRLRFGYGVRDGAGSVVFQVMVNGERVWCDAMPHPSGWREGTVTLTPWAGQNVLLSLVTDSDGSNNCDWAYWGEPRLEAAAEGR